MGHCCPGDQHKTLQFQTTVHADHLANLILVCTLELAILLPSVSGSQGLSLFSERLTLKQNSITASEEGYLHSVAQN